MLALVNLPSIFIWVVPGSKLQRFLDQVARLRAFDLSMALLLLATLSPILNGQA